MFLYYPAAVEDLVRREIEASDRKLTLLNEPELYLALDVRKGVPVPVPVCACMGVGKGEGPCLLPFPPVSLLHPSNFPSLPFLNTTTAL